MYVCACVRAFVLCDYVLPSTVFVVNKVSGLEITSEQCQKAGNTQTVWLLPYYIGACSMKKEVSLDVCSLNYLLIFYFRCFTEMDGIDPSLTTTQWFENHYKWIVWKLSSLEVMYQKNFRGNLLNPVNILKQLKYRYEREIDKSERYQTNFM